MSFWDKAKKTAQKTKLRGKIVLLDRDINTKKKGFGVELYDMMTNDKNKLLGVAAGTLFKGQQTELIKEPFEMARDDIAGIQARKDVKQKDLDVMEVHDASSLPDSTLNQKMAKAGRAISNAGTTKKLQAQTALLDREMKNRKEQFGVEVFDLFLASDQKEKKGQRDSVTINPSNMTQQEKEIQACIDNAKGDVAEIEGRIKSKQTEMNMLDEQMEPLVS